MLNGAVSKNDRYKMELFAGKWDTVFAFQWLDVDGSIRCDKHFSASTTLAFEATIHSSPRLKN